MSRSVVIGGVGAACALPATTPAIDCCSGENIRHLFLSPKRAQARYLLFELAAGEYERSVGADRRGIEHEQPGAKPLVRRTGKRGTAEHQREGEKKTMARMTLVPCREIRVVVGNSDTPSPFRHFCVRCAKWFPRRARICFVLRVPATYSGCKSCRDAAKQAHSASAPPRSIRPPTPLSAISPWPPQADLGHWATAFYRRIVRCTNALAPKQDAGFSAGANLAPEPLDRDSALADTHHRHGSVVRAETEDLLAASGSADHDIDGDEVAENDRIARHRPDRIQQCRAPGRIVGRARRTRSPAAWPSRRPWRCATTPAAPSATTAATAPRRSPERTTGCMPQRSASGFAVSRQRRSGLV